MSWRSSVPSWRLAAGVSLAAMLLAVGTDAVAAQRTITRAEALGVATAISVRHADLPTFKQQSNPMTAQEQRLAAQLTKCAGGVPESEALANTQSPNFVNSSGSSVTVNSATEILPSTALVAKDLAAITGSHGPACLLAELRGELVPSPAKDETVTGRAARLPSVVSGADTAFADRFAVVIRVTHPSTTLILPLYVDLIGFTYGQAEVSLSVMTVGTKPSTALERRLAAPLVARAKAAIG